MDNIPEIEMKSASSPHIDSRYESPSISNSYSIIPAGSSMGSAHKATALLEAACSQANYDNAGGGDDCRVLSTDFGFGRLSIDFSEASASLLDEFSKVSLDAPLPHSSSAFSSGSPHRTTSSSHFGSRSVEFNIPVDSHSRSALYRGNMNGAGASISPRSPSRASSASSTTSSSISLMSNSLVDLSINGNSTNISVPTSSASQRNIGSQLNNSVINMHPVPPVSVMSSLPSGQPPVELIEKFSTYVLLFNQNV